MDELDRLLAAAMHDAAGHAPADTGLLGTVHERSRRRHQRRVATVAGVSTAAVVLAAGLPFATVLADRKDPVTPPVTPAPAAPVPAPSAPSASSPAGTGPSTPPAPIRTSASPRRSEAGTATNSVRLTEGWVAPVFPYTLPPTDGMSEPVVSSQDGNLSAFFEATELREHADVTLTVTSRKPDFPAAAEETGKQVRGHAGTLRTVDVQPARQLTLSWKESPDRWIQLATDDTYTPAQVVALAESLTGASIAVLPPFDLTWSPAGLVPDTVSASRMTFRAPGAGTAGFRTVLRHRRELSGTVRKVGEYDAVLSRRSGSVTLSVDVTDWDATLEVTVSGGLTISDADLVRYAAGVRILNRSDPE